MITFDRMRRSFLFGLGALGLGQALPQGILSAETIPQRGFVLPDRQGEHLVHFRDHGDIFIKISAATGSDNFALGTQQVMTGTGIPVHRHFHMDESFYVLEGSGSFTLNDVPYPVEKGTTIFTPRNTWHGFSNPDHELLLLWIVAPQGLESFFRETCSPAGMPAKQLTREQIRSIALKYGTEFR